MQERDFEFCHSTLNTSKLQRKVENRVSSLSLKIPSAYPAMCGIQCEAGKNYTSEFGSCVYTDFRVQNYTALQASLTDEEEQYISILLNTQYEQMGNFSFHDMVCLLKCVSNQHNLFRVTLDS